MTAVPVRRVPTRTPVSRRGRAADRAAPDNLVLETQAGVARHGTVVLLGRRPQARQLRRLQAALRADGYTAHYFTDETQHQLVVVGAGQDMPRVVGWWGGLD